MARCYPDLTLSRRRFLQHAAGGAAGLLTGSLLLAQNNSGAKAAGDLVGSLELHRILEGQGKFNWFHPRACRVPGKSPYLLMTTQGTHGSDSFGPVHFTESRDLGRTWTDPQPIKTMAPPKVKPSELQEATCDVVPEYHAKTDTVLAVGHNVFNRNNKFYKDQPPRSSVYTVRDATGNWSERKKIIWDDPRGAFIYTCNVSQRVTLDNGDLLIPHTFGAQSEARRVATFKCGFDGKDITVREVGPEIIPSGPKIGRGYIEPSMTVLDGKYYVTIRAEDNRGYVSVSDDGMNWAPQKPWCWDDGTPLDMSTTQQHWVTHSDGLYLAYTRKDETNQYVFRWRTPLFFAMVDRATLRLIRSTERIGVPMLPPPQPKQKIPYGGNFHVTNVSPDETILTESLQTQSYSTRLFACRIRWNKPNRLVV